MRIGYNIQALTANNSLKRTDTRLGKSMEKLSTGYKINHAKDNPAGIAIAKRMRSQIRGLGTAGDNASDGISVVETADGALSEIHDILQRMNELAVQAANGTETSTDREFIQSEISQLKQEITRIAESTEFNGQNLLDGNFDLKGYTDNPNVKVMYYSDEVLFKKYDLESVTTHTDADGNVVVDSVSLLQDGSENAFPDDAVVRSIDKDVVTITASDGFEIKLSVLGSAGAVSMDMTGIGDMRMQVGANEGQVLNIRIPEISLKMLGIEGGDVLTRENAEDMIDQIKEAIQYVSSSRSRLGSYQNRLESTTERLDLTEENMTASFSRIMDVDMAEEMTEYTTQQVLSQAGTSMLAQANERPQQVLQLLQ